MNFSTGGMMHHMVLFNLTGTDTTCDGTIIGNLGERVMASGNERSVITFPDGYGYYVQSGDVWNLVMHLMNMQTSPQEFYLEFTFDYRPGTDEVRALTPIWLDVDNCADSEFDIAAGYSDTHWDWSSDREGDIVGIGGHLHNYGISIAAERVETGEYICTSDAGYATGSSFAPAAVPPDGEGHPGATNELNPGNPEYVGRIEDMKSCSTAFRLKAGETIRLHTQYNPPMLQDGVMGIMIAFMYETTEPPDYDKDGVTDDSDNCPAWPVPANDLDCDGFTIAVETYMGTLPMDACANTPSGDDEGLPNAWPYDRDDNQRADLADVLGYIPVFNSFSPIAPYDPQFDLDASGGITLGDVLSYIPVFNLTC
ncbi:MAG: hypothetical protein IIA91_07335 [Chloroflexi bacterium]|nr:hypothetical protein [Chloroflexota bacterium]